MPSLQVDSCPALLPDFDYHEHWAWGTCPACIDGNADIAGIGVLIGIIGQSFLMNLCVVIWWFTGTPSDWCLNRLGSSYHRSWDLHTWVKAHREKLEKVLLIWADTQTVTGLALTTAGLVQVHTLTLYHLAILLDLLSISSNGQALILFYAFNQRRLRRLKRLARPVHRNLRPRHSHFEPRILTSAAYLGTYYALSALVAKRFRDAAVNNQCLLNLPPQFGNYGSWGLAEASLMFLIYIFAFTQLYFDNSICGVSIHVPGWITQSFLPIYTTVYFLWNLVDIIDLKVANRPTLNIPSAKDGSEDAIQAFGQVVPIVLLLLLLLSLWSLFDPED